MQCAVGTQQGIRLPSSGFHGTWSLAGKTPIKKYTETTLMEVEVSETGLNTHEPKPGIHGREYFQNMV